ncbi:MAG: methyltransferase family protein [Gemmatimonadaceae bacterium]
MTSYSLLAKKLRLPLGFVLGISYLLFAGPKNGFMSPLTLAVGLAIAFGGVLVRGWAAGHIIKNNRLATTGPYAHTRNPLYFGSFLIAAGFAVAAHWALLLLVIAFFVFIYAPTMERERANIRGRFPDAYAEYERNVPSFIPRPVPWRGQGMPAEGTPFSFSLYMKHGEWKALLVYVLAALWLAYRMSRGF